MTKTITEAVRVHPGAMSVSSSGGLTLPFDVVVDGKMVHGEALWPFGEQANPIVVGPAYAALGKVNNWNAALLQLQEARRVWEARK